MKQVPDLTHFTRDLEAVVGILRNGFVLVPNRRELIQALVPSHVFDDREPQAFGMVSFTELDVHEAFEHRGVFGEFGVTVSGSWAESHKAQKVFYVASMGPMFEALQELFQAGYAECKAAIKYEHDAARTMAYTNKWEAMVIGAPRWAALLQVYEYMEPIRNRAQQEWRIANQCPLYGLGESKQELVRSASPPLNWSKHTHVVPLTPTDVTRIICPASRRDELATQLPESYRGVELKVFG